MTTTTHASINGAEDDGLLILTCDEVLIHPSATEPSNEKAPMKKRKHTDEYDDDTAIVARLIVERRDKAAHTVELANRAIDALVDLEAMMDSEVSEDEDAHPLFAEREERDYLLDAQRVAIDIRMRALEYVGGRPPNSPKS